VDADFAVLWNREEQMMKIVLKTEPDMCYALQNAPLLGLLIFKKE